MSEGSRCTEYVEVVAMRKGRDKTPLHIVISKGKSAGWAHCGEMVDARFHVIGSEPWVEVKCRACREAHLREKRRLKPGWWGRSL